MSTSEQALRRAVQFVAVANLSYFGIEFAVALTIGSVSLFADSIDFLEDTSVNLLVLLALGWRATSRARIGKILASLILVPGLSALWTAWEKFTTMVPPDPISLSLTGAGAFLVNLMCAFVLARYRHHNSSLMKAAFLSARNDVFANVAIVAAGFVTAYTVSAWPDLIVGLGIATLNAGAAREVWIASNKEHLEAEA